MAALGDFIKAQRELTKRSMRQVAQAAQISNAYLSQVERGIYKPSADVLRSIADALDISRETLMRQAGLLDPESSTGTGPGVEEAIKVDDRLTAKQKEALLELYRGFTGSAS